MTDLAERLAANRRQGRKSLIIYITAGYPDMESTETAIIAAEAAGADLVEIGIPFSDPIADGPVIQKASAAALAAGATAGSTLAMVRRIRRRSTIPLAVMTYINIVLRYGTAAFVADCRDAGIDALILPDLPPEESALLQEPCDRQGLDLIRFIAPTSDADRIARICRNASGFLYCVSSTGVTGLRPGGQSDVSLGVALARAYTDVPIAIGFGIGTPAAAGAAARQADGVIVGSAVVQLLEHKDFKTMAELIGSMRRELDRKEAPHAAQT